MANRGRAGDGQYPPQPSIWSDQSEEEAWPQSGPVSPPFGQRPPGAAQRHAAQRHAAQQQAAQSQSAQLPPPEWADPAVGRRWTQSWRVRPTGAQPSLPQDQPRMPQGPSPAGRQTGQTGQLPPWETAAAPQGAPRQAGGPVRATGANPSLDPTRATGGLRTTGALSRTTGAMRATGAHASADANTVAGALRTTGAMRTTGVTRATGPMRTAKPISPGTGKARIVLPIVVLAVIGLGLLGTMYLWWRNTLFMHTPGAILTDIGEVLGLLAGYGVIILVALMSRLPPLEKAIGTDRLARWHAFGGRWVITVTSGHVVFIIWGYAVTARQNVVSETVTLWTTFPDVLMATVAWLLLLMVAGFSLRAARRRIAYETWYYAHLYTYLAIALAFSHQFADGGAFAESFQARALWTTLYALIGASLVWFRVVTPIRRTMRHQFTVQSVRPEAEGIVSVLISGRDFDHLRAEPGQFFRWRFLTRHLWWQSHPYSLSAMPQPNLMRITVKARGDHSGSLANLKPGTRIVAEGPYGAFTPSLTGRRVLFIAGGVGITPIRAMFAALPKRMSGGITLLYRASHPRDVVFSRELNAIAGDRNAALHYLIGSRRELGYDPLDADHLQRTVPGLHRYEAYVCGPTGMTQAAVDALVEAGIPRRRIHHESFDF